MKNLGICVISFILVFAVLGCLGDDDDEVLEAKMTSDEVNAFVIDPGNVNIYNISESNDQLLIEITDETSTTILKQHQAENASAVSYTMTLFDVEYHYEFIKYGKIINYYANETWFYGRDEVPNFVNPVYLAEDQFLEPHYTDAEEALEPREWTMSGQKIDGVFTNLATHTENDTTIKLNIQDSPRRLLRETRIVKDDGLTTRTVTTYGYGVQDLGESTGYDKTSVDIKFQALTTQDDKGNLVYYGNITDEHDQEVMNEEIQLRVVTYYYFSDSREDLANETVLISMGLEQLGRNSTDEAGYFWNVSWNDTDEDGMVSAGDRYQVVTNYSYWDSYDYRIAFFDLWADEYNGEMALPGLGPLYILATWAGAAVTLHRRRAKG